MAKKSGRRAMAGAGPSDDKYDAIFGALADKRSRLSLQYLLNSDIAVTLEELTAELTAWESQLPVTEPESGERDKIKASLHHVHLPKMGDADIVEYDAQKRTVTTSTHTEKARVQLEAMWQ